MKKAIGCVLIVCGLTPMFVIEIVRYGFARVIGALLISVCITALAVLGAWLIAYGDGEK